MAASLGALAMDRQRAADRVMHQATHDALTGLPNRTLLAERILNAAQRANEQGSELAVLFLDVDRFKVVNDTMGNRAGDQLLVELARRLVAAARDTDTIARFGGDEFVLLLEDIEGMNGVAGRLLEAVERPMNLGGQAVQVTASIGIVTGD